MGASDEPRCVHFQSPEYLIDRLDVIAEFFDVDRTDLIVEAIQEYIEDTAGSEPFQEVVKTAYYDDQLEFETVKQLIGVDRAQRLRSPRKNLDESCGFVSTNDIDVYDGNAMSVDTPADDDR